jgi:dolichol-phosphate mannosyltransferase
MRPNLFIVPAFNEEANLPRLFADLEARPSLFPEGSRLIVVDDGSSDGTAELVEAYAGPLPVQCLRMGHNQGPGAAFRAGFLEALEGAPDDALIVTVEADTTSDLDALPAMIRQAEDGADLVLASVHGGGQMLGVSRRRRFLSVGAGLAMRVALGLDAATVSSFFRVYRAEVLREAFDHYGDGFIREPGFACKAEILSKLHQNGARVAEVPVDLDASRRIGESKMQVVPTVLAYGRLAARQWAGRA